MPKYPTHQDKTDRAFRGYMELLDTADWLKAELRVPLASFDVTLAELRVLHLLYREGALPVAEVARRRNCKWNNSVVMIARMESRGWMRRKVVTLPPVEFERAHLANSMRDVERRGRRLTVVGLTAPGKKFMRNLLPNHSKLVKSLMRVLHAREQDSLFRICRKLREGDVLKFVHEITHWERED
jgi:DNA-binding MarR family transcriptional regulator